MKSYFYYKIDSIKNFKENRHLQLVGQEDKILTAEEMEEQGKTELYKDTVIWESELVFVGYPILEGDTLRAATLVELIDLGEQKLLAGEYIDREENSVMYIEQPSYQYTWDFELLKWLPNPDTLQDGQYIEGEEIITVPYTENFLIPVWNKDTHLWEEAATETDKLQDTLNKYLVLNTPLDFIDMEAAGVLGDYKTYIKEAKTYLERAEKEISQLSNIPEPSLKLQNYFNSLNQTLFNVRTKVGGGVLI